MQQLETTPEIDFQTDTYKDAYSRVNAIVIEGEQEAHDNYIQLGEMLPDQKDELVRLSKMEKRHMKGFQACGRNLEVTPDMEYAREFFAPLHSNFQAAAESGKVVTCLLIQSLIIESFAMDKRRNFLQCAICPCFSDAPRSHCGTRPARDQGLNRPCLFPFIYEGVEYDGCTDA